MGIDDSTAPASNLATSPGRARSLSTTGTQPAPRRVGPPARAGAPGRSGPWVVTIAAVWAAAFLGGLAAAPFVGDSTPAGSDRSSGATPLAAASAARRTQPAPGAAADQATTAPLAPPTVSPTTSPATSHPARGPARSAPSAAAAHQGDEAGTPAEPPGRGRGRGNVVRFPGP
jgi:hypothetical protein